MQVILPEYKASFNPSVLKFVNKMVTVSLKEKNTHKHSLCTYLGGSLLHLFAFMFKCNCACIAIDSITFLYSI